MSEYVGHSSFPNVGTAGQKSVYKDVPVWRAADCLRQGDSDHHRRGMSHAKENGELCLTVRRNSPKEVQLYQRQLGC